MKGSKQSAVLGPFIPSFVLVRNGILKAFVDHDLGDDLTIGSPFGCVYYINYVYYHFYESSEADGKSRHPTSLRKNNEE